MEAIETWSFYSNPVKEDTDGDGITDVDDFYPTKFDVTGKLNDEDTIELNTGKTWYCYDYEYGQQLYDEYLKDGADTPIPLEKYDKLLSTVKKNDQQDFNIDELSIIGLFDNEGSKYYMDNKPKRVIEAVFKNIYGRECKYYQRSGILWWSDWEEVPYGTEGGFFEGSVVTEAQLNFTHEKYGSGDIYLLLDFAAGIGIVLISAVVVVDVTLAVMAKLEALAFYVENFGVRQGFEMYKYLGVENLPNGVISWLQADMADGDSSVDDLVEGGGYSNLDEGLNFAKKAAEHMGAL